MKLPLWRRKQKEELDEELRAHHQAAVRERIERGASPAEAAAAARREFGNAALVAEVTRDTWGWGWLDALAQDARYALRRMLRTPGFVLMTVLFLALGIGANGAIFNIANAMLFKPIPGRNPEQLQRLMRQTAEGTQLRSHSYLAYREFRETAEMGSVLASSQVTAAWTHENSAADLLAEVVSENYFDTLGIGVALGRTLSPQFDKPADRSVVVSHRFWRNHLAGDPQAVGKTLMLNGEGFVLVGIAAEKFEGTVGFLTSLWVPLEQASGWVGTRGWTADPTANRLQLFVRRAPGFSAQQTQAVAQTAWQRLVAANAQLNPAETILVAPARMLEGQLRRGATAFFAVLLGIVGLVSLGAAVNLTNLHVVRLLGRRREMAMRMALGASRRRLLQQLLSESLFVALLAGAAACVVASWMSNLLLQLNPLPATIPFFLDLTLDARVYLFVGLLAVGTGLLVGLLPAAQASLPSALAALKEEGTRAAGSASRSRLRQAFVVAQVALSLIVLVSAGLFLQSLLNATRISVGFEPQRALALDLDVQSKGWSQERAEAYYREVRARVERLPGVASVSFANLMPLDLATRHTPVAIDGHEPPPGRGPLRVSFNRVGVGYFVTLHIPLRRGRDFSERDDAQRPAVTVINETMARRFWPGQDPLGKRFRLLAADGGPIEAQMAAGAVEVIGVAADAKYRTLGEATEPHFYLTYLQNFDSARSLVVRTAGEPGPMLGVVQRELLDYDASLPGFFGRTLEQHIALAYVPAQAAGAVSGAFGVVALLLSSLGIYGVLAFSVVQRTQELGIRFALGATKQQVLSLVLGQGMRFVLLGVAVGVAGAAALAGLVQSFLYDVSPLDDWTYAAAAGVLILISLLACWLPARRAARVDPIVALRYE